MGKYDTLVYTRSVLDAREVCPVAFEIWERRKEIYGFHKVR